MSKITLFRGFPNTGTYTWSPFVTKLEARLRFDGIPYKVDIGSPMSAPRGKIPYVSVVTSSPPEQNGYANGDRPTEQIIGDTDIIIQELISQGVLEDLNEGHGEMQSAVDHSVQALLQDKLYFYQGYERWVENYYTMRAGIFSAMPYPLQLIIGYLAYRKNTQTLYGQGTLRFTSEEVAGFRNRIWKYINALLVAAKSKKAAAGGEHEEKDGEVFWIFGEERPTEVDAVVYGFIVSGLVCEAGPDTTRIVRGYPVIMEYAKRIHERYFPDYEFWG